MFTPFAFFQTSETPVIPGLTAVNYGRWVVTRRTTGVNQRAAWSNDGITWNLATTPNSLNYYFSSFSPELGLYVAGADAQTNTYMTSTNGVTWTSRSRPATGSCGPIEWCYGWNKFLAIQRCETPTTSFNIIESYDGINWTQIFTQSGYATVAEGAAWIWDAEFALTPNGYEYLCSYRISPGFTFSIAIYSNDGSTFTTYSMPLINSHTGFLYNTTLNLWMAWAAEGPTTTTAQILISSTASSSSSWTRYTNQRAPTGALVFGVATSNDGQNGNTYSPPRTVITNLSGASTTTPIRYSDTLQSGSWTNSTLPSAAYGFYDCAYSRALNQWLAVRTQTNFYTSQNGSTWTLRTYPGNEFVSGIFGEGVRTTGYRAGAGIT